MSKHKSAAKEKEKSGQLVIRVAKSERAAFIAACEAQDTTAAREIRRFMREYVAAQAPQQAEAQPPVAAEPVVEAVPAETAPPEVPAQPSLDAAEKPKKARRSVKS